MDEPAFPRPISLGARRMTSGMDEQERVSRRELLRIVGGGAPLVSLLAGCAADGGTESGVMTDQGQPRMDETLRPEPIANYHCETGENPLWDDQR